MRILHTADWHVGRTIRGRSRAEEQVAVLAEVAGVAAAETADLVLVAGDVFDTAAPTPDAERVAYRALLDLADTGAEVVVVAGNHDHPQRLAAVAPVLAATRVHVGAQVARPDEGGVIDVQVRTGETARIALVPFVSQQGIVRADELMRADASETAQTYAERVRAVIAALTAGFGDDTVNLVVAHLMVAGGLLGGGERSAHTVFDYWVPATAFPATAHYVALGHLHRPQRIDAAAPVWYSGSPLQLDFGESGEEKAVLVVDAAPGRPAAVRSVALTAGRRLRTVRGPLGDLEELAGTTGDDHVRVVVTGGSRAGLADEVRRWFPDAVDVVVEATASEGSRDRPARLGRSSRALFAEYLAERDAEDPRVAALFAELHDELESASDQE